MGGEGGATVLWQRGFGAASGVSTVGTEGGPASLPAGFILRAGEDAIVAEVSFDYRPAFFDRVLQPGVLHASAIHRPRFGALTSLAP